MTSTNAKPVTDAKPITDAKPVTNAKPVIIVGAGPVGLTTALGLHFYGVPVLAFEEDDTLSLDTKAGTILTRTIEAFRRYGVADAVLSKALRIDEIGDIERATNTAKPSVRLDLLAEDTRYPFVINLPQHHLEPILQDALEERRPDILQMNHRLTRFSQTPDGVTAVFETPQGTRTVEGSYLLACDGGRSAIRAQLGIEVEGQSLDIRYMLVDMVVDLDVANFRDFPYLAYFSDPQEWMILVRQPHCWRFLFALPPGTEEPDEAALAAKVLHFIGTVDTYEVINRVVYRVHHRIASEWRRDRVFLMGDAAHLITPMWALGLNTGVLDAINLPWRLAWVLRGWAEPSLLDGYAREQKPVAAKGSGEMAEAARRYMGGQKDSVKAMSGDSWANAYTRAMLGVRLDVEGTDDWSMVKTQKEPIRVGERIPDAVLHGADGRPIRLHDLTDDSFVALYFTDVRRRPSLPGTSRPGIRHYAVSRWDAPLDSGLRDRCLFDPGDRLRLRLQCAPDTVLILRPDDHVAAILPLGDGLVDAFYARLLGHV